MIATPSVPPLVGITAGNDPKNPDCYVLRWDYVRSIERAGGIPVVLAPSGPALHATFLDRLDGLVLTGGVDLSPSLYGQVAHETVKKTSADRDEFEMLLLTEAFRRDLPVLGICRGAQMLNVARGGTLVQDIPSLVLKTPASHNDDGRPRSAIAHPVHVERGSTLHRILGRTDVEVNSFHHQAADRLGDGLVPTAWAPDGVVEGIELVEASFALGVQWHPEAFWQDFDRFGALFRAFAVAAVAYRNGASALAA